VVTRQEAGDMSMYAVWRSLHWQDSISIARYIADFWGSMSPEPMAWIELAAGRLSALDALMSGEDSLTWTDDAILRYRASVNMPGGVGESSEIVRMLREHMGAHTYARWTMQMLRLWYLGMLSVRLEELDQAGAYADSMVQLATDSIAPEADSGYVQFGVDLPAEVRAAIALEIGDSDRALALLEDVMTTNDTPGDDLAFMITRRRPFTRLQRGYILLEKGRFEEADGWFATFPDHGPPNEEFAFLSQALRGRAMAHDSLGRYDEALHYYRRFVTRWQDADPHLQPQVEEARQRIRELEAELS